MAKVRKSRGVLIIDYRDAAGKRHRPVVADRAEGHRKLAEIEANDRREPIKGTFREYGDWWLENCARGNIKESTYEEYKRCLEDHVYPVFGHKRFTKITRKMVRELIAAKQKDVPAASQGNKPKRGLSQSSIRNILAPVRGMYNQAMDDEEAFRNPAARMGKFNKKKSVKPAINPLTREEVQILTDKAATDFAHQYPLFLCAPRSGLRKGELVALKGTDLDFNGRFIDVQRNFYRGRITAPKNGRSRRVDMSQQLAGVLKDLLARKRKTALTKEMQKPAEDRRDAATVVNAVMDDWLFTTPIGTQLDPSNCTKVFHKLLTAAKLRRVRFHDLRHTFASLLIQQGESLAYVKEQMGHSSIKVTVDTYGHLVPGGNRQAVDKLDKRVQVGNNGEAATG